MQRRTAPRVITRVDSASESGEREDRVAVEAPLTVVARGEICLTTMRTPGDDRDLIVGWLYHEGLVRDPSREISRLSVCGRPHDENYGDAYELVPGPWMEEKLRERDPSLNRTQLTSCSLCGVHSLAELAQQTPSVAPSADAETWEATTVATLFQTALCHQPVFAETGATHCASLVTRAGEVLLTREDVGRHNAVDKVVGHLALAGRLPPPNDQALLVSSRASFEIVHKAAVAGFSAVFCVSAPTSLAIELAERCNILLAGFFRAGAFNVYSQRSRVVSRAP